MSHLEQFKLGSSDFSRFFCFIYLLAPSSGLQYHIAKMPEPLSLQDLDLRLMPDWLREDASRPTTKTPASGQSGRGGLDEEEESAFTLAGADHRPQRKQGRDRQDHASRRPSQRQSRDGKGRPHSMGRQNTANRPAEGPGFARGPERRDRPNLEVNRPHRSHQREARTDHQTHRKPQAELPPKPDIAVSIDLTPEEQFIAAITSRIKSSLVTFPVFDLARLFLAEPNRYRVRIQSKDDTLSFYLLADNIGLATTQAELHEIAFQKFRSRFYAEELVEGEEIKGSFHSIARCRLNGALLGPTNHHSYQQALRRVYEKEFAQRMPFEKFRLSVEIVADEAVVNQWKTEVRQQLRYSTLPAEGVEPTFFNSENETRVHFLTHHFPSLITETKQVELSGVEALEGCRGDLLKAVQYAFASESRFPATMGRFVSSSLQKRGLHIFKVDKRIVCASPVRPSPPETNLDKLSVGVRRLLEEIGRRPGANRRHLAKVILGKTEPETEDPDSVEHKDFVTARATLLADLQFAIKAGWLYELSNGSIYQTKASTFSRTSGQAPRSKPPSPENKSPAAKAPNQGKPIPEQAQTAPLLLEEATTSVALPETNGISPESGTSRESIAESENPPTEPLQFGNQDKRDMPSDTGAHTEAEAEAATIEFVQEREAPHPVELPSKESGRSPLIACYPETCEVKEPVEAQPVAW